jgi:hypothetical protein
MPPLQFWGLHAAMIIAAGVVFVIVKLLFGRLLTAAEDDTFVDAKAQPAG